MGDNWQRRDMCITWQKEIKWAGALCNIRIIYAATPLHTFGSTLILAYLHFFSSRNRFAFSPFAETVRCTINSVGSGWRIISATSYGILFLQELELVFFFLFGEMMVIIANSICWCILIYTYIMLFSKNNTCFIIELPYQILTHSFLSYLESVFHILAREIFVRWAKI